MASGTASPRGNRTRSPRATRPSESNVRSESAAIGYHLLRNARRSGIDIAGLEERFGVPIDSPLDITRRVQLAYGYELWEELLRRTADPSFPFEMATIPFPESVALFVLVTTSRRTVREALEVLVTRFALISDAVRFELAVANRSATVHVVGPASSRIGAAAAVEFLVGHIVHNLRCATGNRCRIRRVQFAHADRGARQGPTTIFGGRETLIEIEAADLELPLDVLDGLEQILTSRIGPPDLVSRVRNAIALSLAASGRAAIGPIAKTVGLTPRTLQRQLPPGVTFQALVQHAQRELAIALVRARPDLAIKEISTRVGFTSARAFSRAYRRWTGSQPTSGRARENL